MEAHCSTMRMLFWILQPELKSGHGQDDDDGVYKAGVPISAVPDDGEWAMMMANGDASHRAHAQHRIFFLCHSRRLDNVKNYHIISIQ